MATHTRERIRIKFDVESLKAQTDEIAGGTPAMWRNNDVQFELGFFFDDEPIDASPFSEIKIIVKELDNRQASAPLMQGVVSSASMTPVFTAEEWNNQQKQHCILSFAAADTRLDLKGEDSRGFWLAVIARTADGKRITLGSTTLTLHHDGEDETSVLPPVGSTIVPSSASYSGAGIYVLSGLTPGRWYSYQMGTNDDKLVNGDQELTESENFQANGATVTLHGDANQLVTASVRYPVFLTQDEQDARYQRTVQPWAVSPNGRWMRINSVDDNGKRIDQVIALQNL